MISVSDKFKTWMEKQTLNLVRKFTYDDVNETERIEGFGSINRASDSIVSGGTSLALINTDKYWNKFISDKTNLRRTAKLQLGIEYAPDDYEWLDILTGWADDPEFLEALVNLPIRDKFAGLLEKELGSEESPLDYYSSAYNPADLAWDILTTHGGLDSTASAANTDIDYTTWSAWKTACTTANLSLRARFIGQTIREALELIRDLTNSDIYEAGAGKLKFFRFVKGVPPSERYLFDTDKFNSFSVKLDGEKIINYLKVYYGYDPATETWTGSYLKEDATSQQPPPDGFGLCSETVDSIIVWHDTLASATSYADRRIQTYANPLEIISFTSFMMGMITEIGDIVRITNAFYGYEGDPYYRVFKITDLNLAAGTIRFEIANFEDVLGYSYSTPSSAEASSEAAADSFLLYYPLSDYTHIWGLSGTMKQRYGQKITLTGDTLTRVKFCLSKYGAPTGTLYARVRKVSDDSVIETSGDTLDVSTLPSYPGTPQWVEFGLTCTPNEAVRISCEYDGGDSSNYVVVHSEFPAVAVYEGVLTYYSSGAWDDDAMHDLGIILYKSEAGPGISNEAGNTDRILHAATYTKSGQQVFLVSDDPLEKVSFKLKKSGAPPGTIYARVRKASNDDIIETSPTTYAASGLSTAYEWKDFVFTCTPDEEVKVQIEYTGGDAGNYVATQFQNTDVIVGKLCMNGSSDANKDHTIKIYFGGGCPASNSIDDILTTYWLPDPPNESGAWTSWDMGSLKYTKGCRIYWGSEVAYRPTEYKLWVSVNGTDWTEVAHETEAAPASAWKTYSWDLQEIRYFKLTVITHGASGTKVYEADEYSI